jgi:hypothetical protein
MARGGLLMAFHRGGPYSIPGQFIPVFSPVSFHQYTIPIFIHTLLSSGQKQAIPGNLPESNALLEIGQYWLASPFTWPLRLTMPSYSDNDPKITWGAALCTVQYKFPGQTSE